MQELALLHTGTPPLPSYNSEEFLSPCMVSTTLFLQINDKLTPPETSKKVGITNFFYKKGETLYEKDTYIYPSSGTSYY